MVVIRLARGGARNRPFYNVVVTDSRSRRDGRFIERVGYYNPLISEEKSDSLKLQVERVNFWCEKGANVSPTVAKLLKRFARRNPVVA